MQLQELPWVWGEMHLFPKMDGCWGLCNQKLKLNYSSYHGGGKKSIFAHFLNLSYHVSARLLPSIILEFPDQKKHRLLHPTDLHAFYPHHHPLLGLLLDQL